jgi:hypothetical protein
MSGKNSLIGVWDEDRGKRSIDYCISNCDFSKCKFSDCIFDNIDIKSTIFPKWPYVTFTKCKENDIAYNQYIKCLGSKTPFNPLVSGFSADAICYSWEYLKKHYCVDVDDTQAKEIFSKLDFVIM